MVISSKYSRNNKVELQVDDSGQIVKIIYDDKEKHFEIDSDFTFTKNFSGLTQKNLQEIMFEVGQAIENNSTDPLSGFIVAATDTFNLDHLTMFYKGSHIKEMPIIGAVPEGAVPGSPTSSVGSLSE